MGDSPEVWRGAFDYSDLSFHNFLTYWPRVVRLEGRMLRGSFEALRDTRIREARKWASAIKKGKEREKEEKESGKGEVEGMKVSSWEDDPRSFLRPPPPPPRSPSSPTLRPPRQNSKPNR